ncbi:MAG: tRNA preQ1(34) S-adenosylmethionine ribosyltransferase-isomerase QueA [Oscillospiraceae bacterium]|nr:tRNA preQ1(34) S-adenosylmethionine ribosyltransferase-isomerase QueA [Oscillospiraceae bacterium]MBQ3049898.1 tRNA preQ1(34) S-adenosylmethionine ribosyltransferase-isomerase QueA [Oscillospiraceae bacterium]
MKKQDFYYDLPQELIAQHPIEPRDHSRLMVYDKASGELSHHRFFELDELLRPGDLLVMNDSRVVPARLYGEKSGTGAAVELLLLKQLSADTWETLAKPGKRLKKGARITFAEGLLEAEIIETIDDGNRIVKFFFEGNFYNLLEKVGQMPLPHYITERLEDAERYQTIYSRELGSAAAPTAGLHFTDALFERLKEKGVNTAFVTLHVGLGTFRPVKEDDILKHKMHVEHYQLPEETAKAINETKKNGGRVIAVGTTSCRTLESVAMKNGCICADEDNTGIFIYPGYEFKVLDGLITNFHLPESTLIMLVSAMIGRENVMHCYETAIAERYRFFSFGDAMAII